VHFHADNIRRGAVAAFLRDLLRHLRGLLVQKAGLVMLLLTKVLDCERGRIPFGPVARRFNLQPDFSAFDLETGNVDFRNSVIPENAVVCMAADIGPLAMYRQSLGNAKEAQVTTTIHNRRFRRYIGRDRVILGPSALEQLVTMGRNMAWLLKKLRD
jgi:hypothetical protein